MSQILFGRVLAFLSPYFSSSLKGSDHPFGYFRADQNHGSDTMLKRREESLEEEMISLIDRLYNGGETLYRRGENMKMENTINQT